MNIYFILLRYNLAKPCGRTIYHTLLVFNVLSTFTHYFTQNIMLSRVNTYNFHSNVKEIKKISVNQLFQQRVMASVIFTHGDNPKLLSDDVWTIFRRCDFLSKYSFKLYYFNYFEHRNLNFYQYDEKYVIWAVKFHSKTPD